MYGITHVANNNNTIQITQFLLKTSLLCCDNSSTKHRRVVPSNAAAKITLLLPGVNPLCWREFVTRADK